MSRPPYPEQNRVQRQEKSDLVELRRMPPDAVAEVPSPRQRSRNSVRMVRQAVEKTADAAHRHRRDDRDCENVPGAPLDPETALRPFDGNGAAEEASHNRLAVKPDQRRAPERGSQDRRDNKPAPLRIGKKVACEPPLPRV